MTTPPAFPSKPDNDPTKKHAKPKFPTGKGEHGNRGPAQKPTRGGNVNQPMRKTNVSRGR